MFDAIPTRRRVLALPATALPLLAAAMAPAPLAGQAPPDAPVRVDAVFADWDSAVTPGCAAGVAVDGLTVFADAWGMADLEWGIAATDRTIYEAGSVSKQFTAAAVVLLSLDGALSLDDDIRMYIPEVPDYGETITITHLMNHTSGLRDWGSVAGMSGWGREQRTHDHRHVLDIVSRQSALNFPPGHEYSYSNTGYNLLAILVERVSGMSFAEFSNARVFGPAGLLDTQWRDDYRRLVPGRSTAYNRAGDGFERNQPIENVHGNGGLLTTVHDLLKWNEAFRTELFGAEFNRIMQTNGVLNDGRTITYARGLNVGESGGVPSVTHTGATSGYRAYLGRFPEDGLSVAVLCNVASVNPGGLGNAVADIYLGGRMAAAPLPEPAVELPAADLERWTGMWVEEQTGQDQTVRVREGRLAWGNTPLIVRSSDARSAVFAVGASGQTLHFGMGGNADAAVLMDGAVEVDRFARVEPMTDADVTPDMIRELVGTYWSPDAEFALEIVVDEQGAGIIRRPGQRMPGRPVYRDAWNTPLGMVRVLRDASGSVTGLTVYQSRVYDMRFMKVDEVPGGR